MFSHNLPPQFTLDITQFLKNKFLGFNNLNL